jgi:hypothetical protein
MRSRLHAAVAAVAECFVIGAVILGAGIVAVASAAAPLQLR